jgi:hypothetical protein
VCSNCLHIQHPVSRQVLCKPSTTAHQPSDTLRLAVSTAGWAVPPGSSAAPGACALQQAAKWSATGSEAIHCPGGAPVVLRYQRPCLAAGCLASLPWPLPAASPPLLDPDWCHATCCPPHTRPTWAAITCHPSPPITQRQTVPHTIPHPRSPHTSLTPLLTPPLMPPLHLLSHRLRHQCPAQPPPGRCTRCPTQPIPLLSLSPTPRPSARQLPPCLLSCWPPLPSWWPPCCPPCASPQLA